MRISYLTIRSLLVIKRLKRLFGTTHELRLEEDIKNVISTDMKKILRDAIREKAITCKTCKEKSPWIYASYITHSGIPGFVMRTSGFLILVSLFLSACSDIPYFLAHGPDFDLLYCEALIVGFFAWIHYSLRLIEHRKSFIDHKEAALVLGYKELIIPHLARRLDFITTKLIGEKSEYKHHESQAFRMIGHARETNQKIRNMLFHGTTDPNDPTRKHLEMLHEKIIGIEEKHEFDLTQLRTHRSNIENAIHAVRIRLEGPLAEQLALEDINRSAQLLLNTSPEISARIEMYLLTSFTQLRYELTGMSKALHDLCVDIASQPHRQRSSAIEDMQEIKHIARQIAE